MINKLKYIPALILAVGLFSSCQKIEAVPDVSQPIIRLNVDKGTTQIAGQTVATGPEKDYEQDSDVFYKLTVSSSKPLSRLIVNTTAEKISQLSRVVRTEPENAIDANGNFIEKVNEVVVIYAFHIDPAVTPTSSVSVTFTFQNESNYIGLSSHTFSAIKKGSTSGKPLSTIAMQFSVYNREGIGTQDNLDLVGGLKPITGDLRISRGPFYSLENRADIEVSADALRLADKIDLVGYKTKAAGTNPVLANGQYYLVSPSDTVVLTSRYVGAPASPDNQSLKMRNTIRDLAAKLKGEGKGLRKTYFKRLDNITGPGQLTPTAFDQLTHDNEFDILLAGIETDAQTIAGPVGFSEVYGFVMDNGRRGLIKTISSTIQVTSDQAGLVVGQIYNIPAPSSNNNLLCTIKFQDK